MAAAALVSLGACSDNWDDHYGPDSSLVADTTVYEMIKSDPSLETFGRMIDIAGYAGLLDTSQTFTVWAPDNEALAGVDLSDEDEVRRIVANHVARFNVSTASSGDVRMYNGKVMRFDGNTFGGAELRRSDIVVRNGVMHVLASRIPYSYNIREYIDTHAETSSLSAFLRRFDENKFDEASSAPIDIDENGNTVYDSVKVVYNRLFQHPRLGLGDILAEDSVFTMVVPDNNAWREAYDRISPLFNVYDADPGRADSIRDVQTSLAIVRDLIFRQRVTDPGSLSSLTATSGSILPDPAGLFSGAEKINASNGMIYLSPLVGYDTRATYFPEVGVEAEDATGRVRGASTTIYTRSVDTSNPLFAQVSEGSYIEVVGTSTSAQPSVTFQIPNVLSGSYDIYVSIVPASIEDAGVTGDRTRLKFVLSYLGEDGKNKTKSFEDNTAFLTNATEMTVIKVASGFQFPVSNFVDNLWLMEEGNDLSTATFTTKLFVQTSVKNTEFNNNELTRNFRVDRVWLEPSEK